MADPDLYQLKGPHQEKQMLSGMRKEECIDTDNIWKHKTIGLSEESLPETCQRHELGTGKPGGWGSALEPMISRGSRGRSENPTL